MITELRVQRLTQIRQPKHWHSSRIEKQIIKNHFIARVDRYLLGPHPKIRLLRIIRGDPRIFADVNFFSSPIFRGEFSGFEQDRIDRRPQFAGIQKFSFVIVNRPITTLENVSLIGADVSLERYGLRLEVYHRAVGEGFEPVISRDLDPWPPIVQTGVLTTLDHAAAEIVDVQIFGHRNCRSVGRSKLDLRRRGNRHDRIAGQQQSATVGKHLSLLRDKRQKQQRKDNPSTKF